MSRIVDALALSHVPRWAIVRHTVPQSVADHSFRVTLIAGEICSRCTILGDDVRLMNVMLRAMYHDLDECVTGDITSFIDKPHAGLGYLETPVTMAELRLIKTADIIEAETFIRMNGVGPHAAWVADDLAEKLNRQTKGVAWADAAWEIRGEILREDGRMRK